MCSCLSENPKCPVSAFLTSLMWHRMKKWMQIYQIYSISQHFHHTPKTMIYDRVNFTFRCWPKIILHPPTHPFIHPFSYLLCTFEARHIVVHCSSVSAGILPLLITPKCTSSSGVYKPNSSFLGYLRHDLPSSVSDLLVLFAFVQSHTPSQRGCWHRWKCLSYLQTTARQSCKSGTFTGLCSGWQFTKETTGLWTTCKMRENSCPISMCGRTKKSGIGIMKFTCLTSQLPLASIGHEFLKNPCFLRSSSMYEVPVCKYCLLHRVFLLC